MTSDNDDPTLERIERELARSLRPARVRAEVAERVAERLDAPTRRMSYADRVLAMFVGSGAVAACVIVGIVTSNMIRSGSGSGGGGSFTTAPPVALATATQPAEPPVLSLGRLWLARSGAMDPLSAAR